MARPRRPEFSDDAARALIDLAHDNASLSLRGSRPDTLYRRERTSWRAYQQTIKPTLAPFASRLPAVEEELETREGMHLIRIPADKLRKYTRYNVEGSVYWVPSRQVEEIREEERERFSVAYEHIRHRKPTGGYIEVWLVEDGDILYNISEVARKRELGRDVDDE